MVRPDGLEVRMLGGFSIRCGSREISDSDNRSKKVWLLLSYMIFYRNRSISQTELLDLLWGADDGSSNPVNALKTMLHRVRATLNQLGENMGYLMVLRRKGSYAWDTETPLFSDADEFEALCRSADGAEDPEQMLSFLLRALELYRGKFLPKLFSEPWVVPISTYYHNLYLHAMQTALSLLESRGRLDEVVALCRRGIAIDPYNENPYRHLMRVLLDQGDQLGAIQVFDELSNLLFSEFGILPSEELRALLREAECTVNDRAVNLEIVREQLRESSAPRGALVCDYDFFRVIYQLQSRTVARSGDAVHIALLSAVGRDSELSKRSLDRCMENLQELIRSNLRRGDVASRCSISQYVILLPQANYESSCQVLNRITKAFARQYPHSPAALHYSVQALEPNL